MARVLTSTPSGGRSEVLVALHDLAGNRSVEMVRFVRALANEFGGTIGAPQFTTDTLSVLADLVDDDLVTGGTSINDRVQLTAAGAREASTHARPRARSIRG